MRIAALGLSLSLALTAGCQDPPPDPDAGVPDSGVPADGGKPEADLGVARGPVQIESGQLYPAVDEAAGGGHILRGRLGAHGVQTATSARHRLRGGLRPLSQ